MYFFFGWLLRVWQQFYHISVWFYPASTGSSAVCPAGHFSSSEQKWRNLDWYRRPGLWAHLQMLRMDSQLSDLKSLTIICLSPFLLPSICLTFSHFTLLSAFPTTVMLPLALLVLTHGIDSHISFIFVREMCFSSFDFPEMHQYSLCFLYFCQKMSTEVLILQQVRQKAPVSSFDRDVFLRGMDSPP